MKKIKFYYRDWFIFLTLILVPPLSIFLMWKGKKFGQTDRIAITLTFVIITLIGIFLIIPSGNNGQNFSQERTSQEASTASEEKSTPEKAETDESETTPQEFQEDNESSSAQGAAQTAVKVNNIELTPAGVESRTDGEIKELIINGFSTTKNELQMLNWTQSILKEVYYASELPNWITVRWYGNPSQDPEQGLLSLYMSFSISKQNLMMVNWNNLDTQSLKSIADRYHSRSDIN
ncbi:hypothetical protein [Fuchsiella alkaliacetigena]|uniref:hypothetical protein n=1 Tax=Fuchsiella alkaliacetigena TaxID=957042 RepID=UPI00200AF549|nr:hypothetical protein [Fuchsiella alkaliacetigena]MCK8824190.1 hypothetical protein [Fuchsiella alkaliacetigena]